MSREFTAFDQATAAVRELVQELEIDFTALDRKVAHCDLEVCHGTCCHDGTYLNDDEAVKIPWLVDHHREEFESFGLDLPNQVVVFGKEEGGFSGPKTPVRPEPMSELAEDYPSHFPDTACVFLTAEGFCGLQMLAENEGSHPWFYKPFTCWMHPLTIERRSNQPPLLTLHDYESDPQKREGYDGFVSRTHCARTNPCGAPAFEVLSTELEMLGHMGNRDLLGEIQSNRVESIT